MKTITFSAIKGGVGKSSLSILTANCLYRAGFKVLVIDMDIQNSTTFYHTPSEEELDKKSIAKALTDNDLKGNIIKGENKPDLIPSSFNLIKIRSIGTNSLSRLISQVDEEYDFCFIDTAPTFDNIVLNALNASDLIITPVKLSQFDWKSTYFFREQLILETEKISNWRILINFFKDPRSDNPDTERNQYISLFREEFEDSLMISTIPDTVFIQKAVDMGVKIKDASKVEKLYWGIGTLAREITEDNFTLPEYF